MPNKRRFWIYLPSALLILSCGYLVYWLSVYQKYDKTFTAMAEAAVPKMKELNNQILFELPPPAGVELVKQGNVELWSPLGTRMYYVQMNVDYEMNEVSPEDIVRYYENLLKETGWQQSQSDLTDPTPDHFYTYYRDSSEFSLSVFYSQYMQKYTVHISNDFWSQTFSPPRTSHEIAVVWCDFHWPVCTVPTTLIKN